MLEGHVSPLQLDQGRVDGSVTLAVGGELDASNAVLLREALEAVADEAAVVIDLRDVPFMDSAGLGALVGGIRRLRVRGAAVALCVRRGAVQRLLAATGFEGIVPTFRSLEEARASVTGLEGGTQRVTA